ncbi:MAG: hypothetical protein M8357_03170 [Desulfobulbaceae bacterium]|nr:hypothetical protein [Desulfobulbaceae bacterium]
MKRRALSAILCSITLLTLSLAGKVMAEPVIQTFTINPGWNAVFLEVEPVWYDTATELAFPDSNPTDAEVVFANLPDLTSAWMWNPRAGTVEFVQDPSTLLPEGPTMLVYDPANPIISNLYSIPGNHAYLINYGGAVPVNWQVKGEPLPPQIDWKPNSFNFVGFHIDSVSPPLFEDFFSSSPAHAGQQIFVLDNATGNWIQVTPTDAMRSGEGFWVYCKGSSEFAGPVTLQLNQGDALSFGTVLEQQEVMVKNDSNTFRTVSLGLADGTLPLYYWEYDVAQDIAQWTRIPQGPAALTVDIAPGESQTIKLGVKRLNLSPDVAYTSNLQIEDADTSFKIGISVTGVGKAGLWVGEATINKVSQPAAYMGSQTAVRPTGSEFKFRLIIHVDAGGQARLLNQVIQMWQEGTWKSDPNDFSKLIVDQPGHFVLLADDALIGSYSGASLRDGQPVGRRISSAAFGNLYGEDNITRVHSRVMTGSFAGDNSTLTLSLFLPKDDPTNPFVHKYNPNHLQPDGSEGAIKLFDINRDITMTFRDTDSEGNFILGSTALGWGSSVVGGIYRETISGLMRTGRDINIEGVFTLHRVNDVDTLTTN